MTGSKEEKQDYQVMAEELLLKVPRQGMSWKTHKKGIVYVVWGSSFCSHMLSFSLSGRYLFEV